MTIRFLATGETFRSLSFQFRIGYNTISYIVKGVTEAIVKYVGKDYIKTPSSTNEWLRISNLFESRWNFPHCLGAIDGKHILITPPPDSGSQYFNYKKSFSVILLAIAGPDYECIYAHIGTSGRANDSGVWNKSDVRIQIEDENLGLPPPSPLPYGREQVPYVFVGDDAFALTTNMMKPCPQRQLTDDKRVYNYRRIRRISDNLFGILANRRRIFMSALKLSPRKVTSITMSALVLHNFSRKSTSRNV